MESGESTRRFLLKTKSKSHSTLPETMFKCTVVFPELKESTICGWKEVLPGGEIEEQVKLLLESIRRCEVL